MKTCPVCALDMEDTYLFCPDDGSGLRTTSNGSSDSAAIASKVPADVSAEDTDRLQDETAGALVLYCPTCASEYPLTFSECPMHGVPLTKRHIPRLSYKEHPATAALPSRQTEAALASRLTRLDLTRPQIEKPQHAPTVATEVAPPAREFNFEQRTAAGPFVESNAELVYPESVTEVHERKLERPGFRVAAIATVLALALFALVAAYALVSSLSRRRTPPVVRVAGATEATPQASPIIPTPQEAQDYKDEQPSPVASTPAPRDEAPPDRRGNGSGSASSTERSARSVVVAQPAPKPSLVTPSQPPPVTTAKVSSSPMPAIPRGSSGGFDARLIRVRSRKTTSGFRYDLTFNMQEQANRGAQWQRVLIATRSASGTSHSEAIPFVHRLGATGALTFTISVELTGRSEADWHGRVVCTTLGWDNKGAPLQASFGANLTP